ncbi:MAG TPA: twin-arginine translocase TatA/TatE family subunit [Ilumatobacteraceae bacterium]|nr:twin-arginine translocase TatA/TatE family subunit [Ilumatobacteraceae bacterium]
MPSGPEWFIVLAIVLLVFGGSQLPKLAKNLGKAQKEFKDGLAEGQQNAGTSPDPKIVEPKVADPKISE